MGGGGGRDEGERGCREKKGREEENEVGEAGTLIRGMLGVGYRIKEISEDPKSFKSENQDCPRIQGAGSE